MRSSGVALRRWIAVFILADPNDRERELRENADF